MLKKSLALAAVFCVSVFLGGCGEKASEPGAMKPTDAQEVSAVVLSERFRPVFEASGSVVPEKRIEIASRLAARIERLPLREGARAAAGDLVLKVDNRDLLASIEAAKAKTKIARKALTDAETDASKVTGLYKEGLVSNNDFRKASLKRDASESNLREAESALGMLEAQLDYAEVKAPAAGRIARVLKEEGAMAIPGVPVLVIDTEENPRFEAEVPEREAGRFTPGAPCEVAVDGVEKPFEGIVERVSESAERRTRTRFVRVRLSGGDLSGVRPGMFGRLRAGAEGEGLPAVPVSALTRLGGLEGVFVIEDGKARFHWLRIGARTAETVEALAGLEGGERVVDRPGPLLWDGAPVRVKAP